MPKERKVRGKRHNKKKAEEKKQQQEFEEAPPVEIYDDVPMGDAEYGYGEATEDANTFYGLLTDEESEYFKRADELLEANEFGDDDERRIFIENLYKEVAGKELKIIHSQGCSRLMERLICTSTPAQLKQLFQSFNGRFSAIVKHRFASHCCETLLLQCAPEVSKELDPSYVEKNMSEADVDEIFCSMETLFLHMINELEPEIVPLLSDRYASHTIRMLLLLLSGRPVASAQQLVQSRKKENVGAAAKTGEEDGSEAMLPVPSSFHEALKKILTTVTRDISVPELRSMAVHQIGSPTLQVVLRAEFGLSQKERKQREKSEVGTLFSKLVGKTEDSEEKKEGDSEMKDTEEPSGDNGAASFVQNLLYDPVGSHLAESLVQYAPRKEFKLLYNTYLGPRIGSLARNETAAFVVQRALERMTPEELTSALTEIIPQIPGLIERNRVSILKTLIDCANAHNLDTTALSTSITSSYSCPPSDFIFRLLHLTPADVTKPPADPNAPFTPKPKADPTTLHGSLLAQSMLSNPGDLAQLVINSLLAQESPVLVGLCKHPQASHVVQKALTSSLPTLKRIMHALRGSWSDLAQDTIGSHIVDACWKANPPTNLRQDVAAELLAKEAEIRESFCGRAVWRNWSMDKYKTNRRMWFSNVKGEGYRMVEMEQGVKEGGRKKTAIELARERHAAMKAKGAGKGANGVAVGKKRGAQEEGGEGREKKVKA